jgi:hypothetical protein
MSVDLLVKLRDAHQQAADALNEEIEKHAPPEVKTEKPTEAQFNSFQWTTKTGTRGDYQQIENDNSQGFKILAEYVKSKGGFCNIYGFKTWFHNNNENIIDRKR